MTGLQAPTQSPPYRPRGAPLALCILAGVMSVLTMLNTDSAATFIGDTWPATLTIFTIFALCTITAAAAVIVALLRRRWAPLIMALAPIVAFAAFYITIALFPSRQIVNLRLGAPILVAARVSTAGFATLTLRPRNRFDLFTGAFGTSSFFPGTYERSGDNYRFSFSKRKPDVYAEVEVAHTHRDDAEGPGHALGRGRHAHCRDGTIAFDSTSTHWAFDLDIVYPSRKTP